jgi:hypothetical protein
MQQATLPPPSPAKPPTFTPVVGPYRQIEDAQSTKLPLWREYWYVTFLVIAFMVLTVAFIIRLFLPEPTLVSDKPNSWGNITPGYATLNQVNQELGTPLNSTQTSRGIENTYSSFNDFTPHQVVADANGTVKFAKEFMRSSPDHTLDQYTSQYGQPDLQLIDHDSSDALTAHVFLEQGLVILAHNADQTVEQKWYFEPTDQATFMNSWGTSLETEGHGPEAGGLP